MEVKMKSQNEKELELARLFEVEELEARMEFSSWSAEGSGDYTPATGQGNADITVTGSFRIK